MAVTCIAFVVIGLAMFFGASGGDRLWGLFAAAFFGICGIAVFTPKGKTTGPGYEATTVNHNGSVQQALAFPLDRRRVRTRVFLSLAFGLVGAGMVLFAEPLADAHFRASEIAIRLVGLAMLLFFGGVGLIALLRGETPSLLLLAEGVLFQAGSSRVYVPWPAIEDIGVVTMHDNDMLAVRVSDRRAVEAGPFARLLMPMNRRMAGAELSFPMDSFVADPGLVLSKLHHFLVNESARSDIALGRAQPVSPSTRNS